MKKPAGGAPTGQAKPTSGMKKGTTNGGKPSGKSLSSMPKTTKERPTGMKGGAGQGGNGIFNVGTAGVTRLFQTALGRQISWFLPLALFGMERLTWLRTIVRRNGGRLTGSNKMFFIGRGG